MKVSIEIKIKEFKFTDNNVEVNFNSTIKGPQLLNKDFEDFYMDSKKQKDLNTALVYMSDRINDLLNRYLSFTSQVIIEDLYKEKPETLQSIIDNDELIFKINFADGKQELYINEKLRLNDFDEYKDLTNKSFDVVIDVISSFKEAFVKTIISSQAFVRLEKTIDLLEEELTKED